MLCIAFGFVAIMLAASVGVGILAIFLSIILGAVGGTIGGIKDFKKKRKKGLDN